MTQELCFGTLLSHRRWIVPAVLLAVTLLDGVCGAPDKNSGSSSLPDRANSKHMLELRCSACVSASSIMKSHLADALFEFQHHAVPDEATRHAMMAAAVDGTCEHEQRSVGLLKSANTHKVLNEYRHELRDDFHGDLVKSVWITELWVNECAEVMQRMKPFFLDHSLGRGVVVEWCPVCTEVVDDLTRSSRPQQVVPPSRSSRHDEL